MGIILSNWRLPIDPAVDVLTRRRWFDYVEVVLNLDHPTHRIWEDAPDVPPRVVYFGKSYRLMIEAFTGRHRGIESHAHFDEVSEDPLFWALYGARRMGWESSDYWLRYSLPGDFPSIREAVGELTRETLRENLAHAHRNPPPNFDQYRVPMGTLDDKLEAIERLPPSFLPGLRHFYEAAEQENEIVLSWLG